MKAYRYYCKYRPPMPGAIPHSGITNLAMFDWPQTFDGIGCWGWVEYSRELTQKEVNEYELVASRNNPLEYD